MSSDSQPFNGSVKLNPGVTFSQLVNVYEGTFDLDLSAEGDYQDDDAEFGFGVHAGVLDYWASDGLSWSHIDEIDTWLGTIAESFAAEGWVHFVDDEPDDFMGPNPLKTKLDHFTAELAIAQANYNRALEDFNAAQT